MFNFYDVSFGSMPTLGVGIPAFIVGTIELPLRRSFQGSVILFCIFQLSLRILIFPTIRLAIELLLSSHL